MEHSSTTTTPPTLVPSETALLVVDVQVRFCTSAEWAAELPSLISNFVEGISTRDFTFIYTRTVGDAHLLPENVRQFRQLKGFRLEPAADDPVSALCKMFMPASALIVQKPIFDAFAYTDLKQRLVERNIRNVLVAGLMTDVCVEATARRAVMEGFHTYLLDDLLAAPPSHAESVRRFLTHFADYYGYVIKSEKLSWAD